MAKHLYIVLGTRAQTIKLAPLLLLLEHNELAYSLLYTQQHKETIEDLLNNFQIKTKPINLISRKIEAKTKLLFFSWSMQLFWLLINPLRSKRFLNKGRGILITHGDTATTLWAAVWGRFYGHEVMHVEAGMRSFKLFNPFPEEIFRILTSYFANYFICPQEYNIQNLKKFRQEKLLLGENTMYDALHLGLKRVDENKIKQVKKGLTLPEKFALISIHRYENIFNKENLKFLMQMLQDSSKTIDLVFVLHPSTRKQLFAEGYFEKLEANKHIKLIERQDFFTFVTITKLASFVMTDGGSNQEEMSYIGKPTLLLRKVTEHQVGLGKNVVLSKLKPKVIDEFVKNYKKYQKPGIHLRISPTQKIIDFIKTKI